MALRLKIVSHHAQKLGARSVKEFGPDGGTIGRSLGCDWVLPDGQRYVSSRHASIDFRSGSYYIVDTSTNGVYVNDAERPVGRGTPQRLFDGDRVRCGEYEMLVEIDEDSIEQVDEHHVDPVDLAQRVEAPESIGDLVDAHEMTSVGIEMQLTNEELETLRLPSTKDGYEIEIELELEPEPAAEPVKPRPHLERRPAATLKRGSPRGGAPPASNGEPHRAVPGGARGRTAGSAMPASQATSAAASRPASTSKAPGAQARRAASPPAAGAQTAAARTAQPSSPGVASAAAEPLREWRSAARTAAAGSHPPHAAPRPAGPHRNAARYAPASPMPEALASAGRDGAGGQLEPFFRGAGIAAPRIDPDRTDALLFCLGQVMREMIAGVSEGLSVRAHQRNALRVPEMTEEPPNDNPLKLSASVEEAIFNLLLRDSAESLTPVEAVRETFADLKQHQLLLLSALRVALESFVARLDPEEVEQKYARVRGGRLMNAANKLKYWDLYKDLYDVVAHHPPGEMPMQFLEDFADAYARELERATKTDARGVPEAQAG